MRISFDSRNALVGMKTERERERMGNGRIFIEVEDRYEDSGMVANFVMYY